MDKIHQKMAAILAEFPVVSKDHKNPSQGYSYRGIDDALAALHPLLAKHGVYLRLTGLQPDFSEAGTTRSGTTQVRCVVTGTVRFVCGEDGSSVEVSLVGEGIDTGDKALMKAQANGLKYVLWYTFAVPTSEKKDSEAFEDPDPAPAPERTKKKKTAPPAAASNGEEILALIAGCRSKGDLEGIRAQVRAYAQALQRGPEKARIVDEFVAAESRLA